MRSYCATGACRTSPRRAANDAKTSERLIRAVPSALWSAWSLRMAPPGASHYRMPAVLACAALLVGTGMSVSEVVGHLGSATRAQTVTWFLNQMSGQIYWSHICTALLRLSDYLDVTRRSTTPDAAHWTTPGSCRTPNGAASAATPTPNKGRPPRPTPPAATCSKRSAGAPPGSYRTTDQLNHGRSSGAREPTISH